MSLLQDLYCFHCLPSSSSSATHASNSRLILNFEESMVQDEQRGLNRDDGGDWEWEWGWGCVDIETDERGSCRYADGTRLQLPNGVLKGNKEGKWESEAGKSFSIGGGMMFVVHAKARWVGGGGEEGDWVSRGRWEGVFSFVEEGEGEDYVMDFIEWGCFGGSGQYGYSVCFSFLSFFLFLPL